MIRRHRPTQAYLETRKTAYQLTFNQNNSWVREVLEDLARICRANETCYAEDVRTHAFNEGKRAIWLRIQQHLNLNAADLYRIYGGPRITETEEIE